MSRENVEIVRRLNAAFNRSPDEPEHWLSHYEEEAEFHPPREWPEACIYRGREEIGELARIWARSFDEYRWEEEKIIDAGACVVALWKHRGRIQGSADWVEQEVGTLWFFRGERIARTLAFFSWSEALEAAGVEE